MKIKGLLTLCVAFCMLSCKAENHKFKLSGVVEGMGNDRAVIQLVGKSISDTVKVKKGKFQFELPSIQSDRYFIKFVDSGLYMPAILDNGNLEISADMKEVDSYFFDKVFVYGSRYNQLRFEYNNLFEDLIKTLPKEDQEIYYTYLEESENKVDPKVKGQKVGEMLQKHPTMMNDLLKLRMEFAEKNADNYFVTEILLAFKNAFEIEDLKRIVSKMPENLKNNRRLDKFNKFLNNSNLREGAHAPLFELPNENGNIVRLESFKGKYVLIDFWASWCGPCRAAIPHLKETYKKYNSKGLEIISVSIDNSKKAWLKASKQEEFPWTNVLDNTEKEGNASEKYNVDAIPKVALIDPEGKILFLQMGASALDARLEKIFEGK